MSAQPQPYHHGDLRSSLLTEADRILRTDGVDGVSLRKLGEAVGVSRTAAYHHFANKNALLCALAEEGFLALRQFMNTFASQPEQSLANQVQRLVEGYVEFALQHPARYELMFGHSIWRNMEPTSTLTTTAHDSFRYYAQQMAQLLQRFAPTAHKQPLRFAQASWAMLHGLCRFMLDGIYGNQQDMSAVSREICAMLIAHVQATTENSHAAS